MATRQGLTVERYLKAKGRLSSTQAAKLVLQAIDQICTSQSYDVVYPGRIFVDTDRSIRLLPLPASEGPVSAEHPHYVAPEVIRSGRQDVGSCLYSIGCTLFEMVTGKPPFPGDDADQVLKAHLEQPAPKAHRVVPEVPRLLAKLISVLLLKDSSQRPGSLEALRKPLNQIINGAAAPENDSAAVGTQHTQSSKIPAPTEDATTERKRRTAKSPSGQRSNGRFKRSATRRRSRRPTQTNGSEKEKSRVCTITGATIGVLIGLFLVQQHVSDQKVERKRQGNESRQQSKEVLDSRKAEIARQYDEKRAHVANYSPTTKDPDLRVAVLRKAIDTHIDAPNVSRLAKALFEAAEARSQANKEVASNEFATIKEQATKLRENERLGAAIKKMSEAFQIQGDYPLAEADTFIEEVSAELTARWEKDRETIGKLIGQGDMKAARSFLKIARTYGDSQIRKAIPAYEKEIENQLAAAKAEKGEEPSPAKSDGEDDGWGDIETEVEDDEDDEDDEDWDDDEDDDWEDDDEDWDDDEDDDWEDEEES